MGFSSTTCAVDQAFYFVAVGSELFKHIAVVNVGSYLKKMVIPTKAIAVKAIATRRVHLRRSSCSRRLRRRCLKYSECLGLLIVLFCLCVYNTPQVLPCPLKSC